MAVDLQLLLRRHGYKLARAAAGDDARRAVFDQGSEHAQQRAHIQRVQADGRLIKDKHCVMLGLAHLAGQLQPLCLAAGQARRFLAQR